MSVPIQISCTRRLWRFLHQDEPDGFHSIEKKTMKKIILALLVVIMAMAPVMADENWVGVDLGVPFGFNFREHSTTTTIGLDATVRTAFYLDREETMGIGAALGFDFKLASKVEDLDFQSVNDNNFTLSPAVSFQYRLELGRDMDLRLGAGLMYSHTFGYSGGNDVFSSSGFAGSLKLTMLMHCVNNTFAVICGQIDGVRDIESFSMIMEDWQYISLLACSLILIVIFIDIVWKNIPMTSEKGNIDVIGNEDLISGDR